MMVRLREKPVFAGSGMVVAYAFQNFCPDASLSGPEERAVSRVLHQAKQIRLNRHRLFQIARGRFRRVGRLRFDVHNDQIHTLRKCPLKSAEAAEKKS